ncbi:MULTISPECIES: LPS-assembly protein LptD [Campylobacter]|uniref:LPS-assembly protein LptD n=1 Tax=Campylobacter TaxID=194 RepID=UPI000A340878|nr:LPS-assembly protein LptD [Campylobacter sp. P0024]MCR8678605.1 LPS-assembly protein LptD [Campylobacter sp. RM19072]MEE3704041.1 LPS-assembly protein LptD [Campylobacter sp. CX2-8023-23]
MRIRSLAFVGLLFNKLLGNVENVEFLASDVQKDGDIITANGNVLLYSQNYLASASSAKYDQKNKIIELFGNVSLMRGEYETSRAEYARIDLSTNEMIFENSFIMDKKKEIWLQGTQSCNSDEMVSVKNSIVSSCNVSDPDWHIGFSKGELNKQSKFLHLYNPVFYVKNTPVMYLPYFGFSTDKTRRTGLLTPQLSYSKDEGLVYLQPFYIAEYNEWDLEFDPQIRTNRGVGLYSTFRFADSPYSSGYIRGGVFEERSEYKQKENLKNKQHSGIEVGYDRDKLVGYLIDGDFKEGLWLEFVNLNDIDYLNLRGRNGGNYDSLVQSKLNYFITTDNQYLGTYAKYYIDTAKIGTKYGNDDTLQELPRIQYHSFFDTFIVPNLTYSFDFKYHNYTRKIGASANQYEIDIPLGLQFGIFDDYANLYLSQNLYASHIDYNRAKYYNGTDFYTNNSDDIINHYHRILLESDIARAFSSFYHTLNFKFDYIKPGYNDGDTNEKLLKYYLIQDGMAYNASNLSLFEDNFIDRISNKYTIERLAFEGSQFFYDSMGQKLIRHSIKQSYNFDDSDMESLENRFNLYYGNFDFANKIEYSHIDNDLSKIQTGISYNGSKIATRVWHTYDKNYYDGDAYDKESYISGSANFKLPYNYELFAGVDYDLQRDYTKMWQSGIHYKRKCWDYSLIYKEDIEPKNTSAGIESKKSQGVYLYFSFYPLGEFKYDFSIEQDSKAIN